ncbi:hypothetical protein EYC84_007298 [Monilinia fructicola]|uniref:Uncharacterized protein n=1 Tax=Monilinia fructicola TaxID=38448 RepID=A0A5M9KED4_MONFR|nr:hypothetical protein EYC84_007298 [Monilinia fructicola]
MLGYHNNLNLMQIILPLIYTKTASTGRHEHHKLNKAFWFESELTFRFSHSSEITSENLKAEQSMNAH